MYYIFNLPEIEKLIYSHLDQIDDWNALKKTNNYYNKLLDNKLLLEQHYDNPLSNNKFIAACENGNILLAKYLHYRMGFLDICAFNNRAFKYSCIRGQLGVAKWLYKTSKEIANKIDIHADNDYVFRYSYREGHLDVIKWLYK